MKGARGRGLLAAAAFLTFPFLAGDGRSLAAQLPRTGFARAIRVSAYLPLRELAHDSLRVASLGAAPAIGVAFLPARGPVQRVLLDGALAMLRVDAESGCTQLNGFACTSEAIYGFTASAAAETGVHGRLGGTLLAYATLGPALRFYGFRNDLVCSPDAVVCGTAASYGRAGLGVGGHAALGIRKAAPGRHLSTELAATLATYRAARTQVEVGATVAFPF